MRRVRECRQGASVLVGVLLAWLLVGAAAGDVTSEESSREKREAQNDALSFLTKFGYLDESNKIGNLLSPEGIVQAVKDMQWFAGLPETGELDAATVAMMQRSRCGVHDDRKNAEKNTKERKRKKRYVLKGPKWSQTDLTYAIDQTKISPELSYGEVRTTVRQAFNMWQESSALVFNEVALSDDVDIRISFGRGHHGDEYPFDGKSGVLAHAFYPGEEIGGDAHFDEDEPWSLDEDKGVHFLAVAAHEFGHSLGLDHSNNQDALMFPYYQGYRDNLPYDDTRGIQALYGPPKTPQRITTTRAPYITRAPYTRLTYSTRRSSGRTPPTTTTTTTPPPSGTPSRCSATFDAVAVVRTELHVYSGKYFYRMTAPGVYESRYGDREPIYQKTSEFWRGLPDEKMDAVYQRSTDGAIIFFIGDRFWVYNDNSGPLPSFPRPLTDLGLPADVRSIDAAFVWGHNQKTYLYSRNRYYRLNEQTGKIDPYYPRSIDIWRGVPYDIDSAFQWNNGTSYFVKDRAYYKFEDQEMMVSYGYPQNAHVDWLGCPASAQIMDYRAVASAGSSSGVLLKYILVIVFIPLLSLCNSHYRL